VLLDSNMLLLDGWGTLAVLKQRPSLRAVPVVIFTTSSVGDHVALAYDMQAAGFVTKPSSYRDLVDIVSGIDRYWFATVA